MIIPQSIQILYNRNGYARQEFSLLACAAPSLMVGAATEINQLGYPEFYASAYCKLAHICRLLRTLFRNNKRKQKKIPQGECLNERGIIPHCFKNAHRDNVNHRQGELKFSWD
jgi:hypothetical protein